VNTPAQPAAARPPRVLVVDDEPQIVRALKVVLREAGFEAIYGTEEKCRAAVIASRWPNGFECPACGGRAHCDADPAYRPLRLPSLASRAFAHQVANHAIQACAQRTANVRARAIRKQRKFASAAVTIITARAASQAY